MKKKTAKVQPPEVEAVRLKPLLGMHPGKYLTIFYAILLLLVLFFLLIYPGLRKFGSEVKVSSEPKGAAIYVDGDYRGSTPAKLFLPAGSHTLQLKKEYFTSYSVTAKVGGRVVGSLFFPRQKEIRTKLELNDSKGLLNERFHQVSTWSMVGSFHNRYRYPALISSTAAALIAQETSQKKVAEEDSATSANTHREKLYTFLHYVINNLNSPEVTLDTLSALGLVFDVQRLSALRSESYPAPSSYHLSGKELTDNTVDLFRQVNIDSQLISLYLYLLADKEEIPDVEETLSVEETLRSLERRQLSFNDTYSNKSGHNAGESISAAGHTFIPFSPEGSIPVGNPNFPYTHEELSYEKLSTFPHRERLDRFYLAAEETTQGQFKRFLEDNSRWRKENTDELAAEGKVDNNYLRYAQLDDDIPVTHISWYAARAYCEWLTTQLPEDLQAAYRIELPGEAQWEYAARMNGRPKSVGASSQVNVPQKAGFSRAGRQGLIDMTGNVWEWNANWFFPADVLDGKYGLDESAVDRGYHGIERSVRGGSWANKIDEELLWSRASQPPSWCTPFTGFRVALVPQENSK